MSFLSLKFIGFIVVLIVMLSFVHNKKYQHIILLAASYIFYAFGDIRFLGLLITVSLLMWHTGKLIEKTKNRKYLVLGIVFDLIVLGIFKYLNFFVESFADILGIKYSSLNIILPVGISFYIFQSLSYIIDIYTGKIKGQSLLSTLLYIGFFPQIVSGPIVKAHDFFPQLEPIYEFKWERFSYGIQRFIMGLFKKLVVADRLGVCVDAVYSAPAAYSGLSLVMAVLSYSLQIYYDFSGYSDMAIGVAYIFGFDLGKNFNLPYLAKNPSEFWKRWHISLSTWFRDYVYIPLGGNREGKLKICRNIFITMLLSGLWHGAGWNFVLWGVLYAIFQIIHKLYIDIIRKYVREKRNVKRKHVTEIISICMNFILVSVLWIPFRNRSLSDVLIIIRKIICWESGIDYVYIFTLIFAVMMIIVEYIAVYRNNGNDIWMPLDFNKFIPKIIFSAFLLIIAVFAYFGNGAFIYAQF